MRPNPLLKQLGLTDTDRVVIFHTDDIGMCQASLAAYMELLDAGIISAAATMVPCPWFPATAAFCRENAARVDIGVHLTLTCEWDSYRWGPLSTRDPASGLLDDEGYLPRRTEAVFAAAQTPGFAAVARAELEAQVARAVAAGIDITHIDTHMGSVFHPALLPAYLELAQRYRVPAMLPRLEEAQIRAMDFPAEMATYFAAQLNTLEAAGLPLLDAILSVDLGQPDDRLAQTLQLLDTLPAGVSYFILHPSKDTPELRAIAPDWRARVADYQVFSDDALRRYIREQGIHVIGYRAIRNLVRQEK